MLQIPIRINTTGADMKHLTLYPIEAPFNPFTNREDQDQAALVRAALSGTTLFAYGNMIYLIYTSGPDKKFLCSKFI